MPIPERTSWDCARYHGCFASESTAAISHRGSFTSTRISGSSHAMSMYGSQCFSTDALERRCTRRTYARSSFDVSRTSWSNPSFLTAMVRHHPLLRARPAPDVRQVVVEPVRIVVGHDEQFFELHADAVETEVRLDRPHPRDRGVIG